jgi:acyl-CoA synthetase (AMP-forming)/AMP-acid ligase II
MLGNTAIGTVRDLIDRQAAAQPDAVFLIGPDSGRLMTFLELWTLALLLSARLRQSGAMPGDRIAFLMEDGRFTISLFFATMYGGFVSVPLNAGAGATQLSHTRDHSAARVVFVGDADNSLLDDVLTQVQRPVEIVTAEPEAVRYSIGALIAADALPALRATDEAVLMCTSGSTGQPKAAVHAHGSVLAHGRNSIPAHELTGADRSLLVLPPYHINAGCVTLLPTLMSGGSLVVPRQFAVGEFWNILCEWCCTWHAVVPTIISKLLDRNDPMAASRADAVRRIRFLREVLLRGDALARGYDNDAAATASAVDAQGWLHTGDLAYRDADGYLFVVGRSKGLAIKGGVNVAPKQIDEVLDLHPAVLEAAAVGVPDRYLGGDLVAFAILRDGQGCDETALLRFCEARRGAFKTPTLIYFVQDLPKGRSGQIHSHAGADRPGHRLYLEAEYSTDLFDEARIERLVGHLQTLLQGAVAKPEQRLLDLPLLTPAEQRQWLNAWNAVEADEVYS